MRRLLYAGALALALSGCAQDGSVDWGTVGNVTGAVLDGVSALAGGFVAGYEIAHPVYVPPPTTVVVVCHSWWGC